jgi:hypothetical protein
MAWELYYTSAPRGLRPGSRGFCTVARTQGMPLQLIDRLESLSGYHQAGTYGTSSGFLAPVLLAHWRIAIAGRTRSVLSRVALVGSDYSGRLNKLAYHLVLEPGEQSPAGPAWMLTQPGIMRTAWEGEPRLLPPRRLSVPVAPGTLSDGSLDAASGNRHARALADGFGMDASKSAAVIYAAGDDPLPLVAEALALLEPKKRWQVTFSTCFSELSAGSTCNWRCVLAGTPAAAEAARHATSGVVIDLTSG